MKSQRYDVPPVASRTLLGLIAIVLIASGCDSNQNRFVGTWSSNMLPNRLLAEEASPLDLRGGDVAPATGRDYSICLRFYRNGRLDTVTKLPNIQTQKSGQWRLLSMDEAAGTATIECELMQQRTQHQVKFLDARTIQLVPPNMAGLKLTLEFKKDP